MNAPCYRCARRAINCHTACTDYAEYRKVCNQIQTAREAERRIDAERTETMIDINIAADGTITLYECDPAKNTACKHEWCAANHPNKPNLQCHRTTNPDFALKGTRPVQVDTRTGKEVIL